MINALTSTVASEVSGRVILASTTPTVTHLNLLRKNRPYRFFVISYALSQTGECVSSIFILCNYGIFIWLIEFPCLDGFRIFHQLRCYKEG